MPNTDYANEALLPNLHQSKAVLQRIESMHSRLSALTLEFFAAVNQYTKLTVNDGSGKAVMLGLWM